MNRGGLTRDQPFFDPKRLKLTLFGPPILLLSIGILLTIIVKLCGANPKVAFGYFFSGSMGSLTAWGETLSRCTVLALSGMAVTVSFRTGLFNIGAEGQFLVGAAAAAAFALKVIPDGTPWLLAVPALWVVGMLAGAAWSSIAGGLRQWRGVSEVITTLMLNLIAIWLVKCLVNHPNLLQPLDSVYPKSGPLPDGAQLEGWGGTSFHAGAFLVIPVILFIHVLLFHTRTGLAVRATGLNPSAAKACGVRVAGVSLFVFALSGALAGLGGATAVMATGHLPEDLFTDYGYMAIAVALVAGLHPLAVLPSALFFAVLETGAKSMERHADVPSQVVFLVEGIVILALLLRGMRLPGTESQKGAAAEASE